MASISERADSASAPRWWRRLGARLSPGRHKAAGRPGAGGLDSLPLAVLQIRGEAIAYANGAAGALLGDRADTLVGRALTDFMDVSESGEGGEVYRMQRGDGATFLAEATFTDHRFPDGGRGFQLTLRDVTALRRTSRLLDQLLAHSPVALLAIDGDGRLVSARGQGLARLGLTESGVTGRPADEVMPASMAAMRAAWAAGEHVYETRDVATPNGPAAFAHFLFADPIAADERLYCLALDITERVAQEKHADALAQRNAMFATALQETKRGIQITDPHQRDNPLIYVNPAVETITGYPAEEMLGRNCRMLQGPATDPAAVAEIRRGIGERRSVTVILLNYRRDGSTFWNEVIVSPVFNDAAQTELLYFIGISEDVTGRLELARERTQLAEQVQRAQKMEAVGRLAGGIAHDFNNVLATVLGNADLMLEDAPDGATRDMAKQVMGAAERGREMVQRLLAFSRQDASRRNEEVHLAELVTDTAELLRPSLPGTASLAVRIDPAAAETGIQADATQLQQVILNIALNAAHAVDHNPAALTIAVDRVRIDGGRRHGLASLGEAGDGALLVEGGCDQADGSPDSAEVRVFTGLLDAGAHLRLSLSDTGPGMDRATAERLFEPFFTTKPVGEGTGLGLPAVQGIVLDHGGAMTVVTAPGKGTRFDIHLPLPDAVPTETA